MDNWIKSLVKMGACKDALEWWGRYPSLKDAWQNCERGDWMLWLVGKLSGKSGSLARKKLVLAACQCARLSLKYVKKGEIRPLKAIETAEAWAREDEGVSLQDVRAADAAYAAYAAYAAAYAAYADAAAYAAYAAAAYAAYAAAAYAAYAAYADDAAAYAAYAAADDAAAYAAYADDAAAYARISVLKECADIVRKFYPEAPIIESEGNVK
jgi:hypothetical protein